jgi:cytochrome c
MFRFFMTIAVGLLGFAPSAAVLANEPYGVLVDEPGVEATYVHCAACHSERLVAQQGLTRERWDKLLVWMVDEQGMQEIPDAERDTILDYLAQHYGPDRPNFPR